MFDDPNYKVYKPKEIVIFEEGEHKLLFQTNDMFLRMKRHNYMMKGLLAFSGYRLISSLGRARVFRSIFWALATSGFAVATSLSNNTTHRIVSSISLHSNGLAVDVH
mmetsp:Transcript_4513/g.6800  ORF Transcript_4513/g.6800 Transcript_4513/m.6800 type:complete len:107 (+) Transcript_4513:268-588(+)